MGTRLYPANEEEVLIEKFGPKTVQKSVKFEEWLEKFPSSDEDEKGYSEYSVRRVFNHYEEIHHFKMFGYGRLNEGAVKAIKEAGSSYGLGSTTDENLIAKLKVAMNITDKVTGFSWS